MYFWTCDVMDWNGLLFKYNLRGSVNESLPYFFMLNLILWITYTGEESNKSLLKMVGFVATLVNIFG